MSLLRRNFAATLALASLTFASVSIGLAPSASAIINGTEISSGALADGAEFGWLVRLEGVGDARCTGSLIDSEWVLTAAHCADIGFESDITAFFGPIGSDAGIVISETVVHPSYDGDSEADLALMRLSVPATRALVPLIGTSDSLGSGTDVQLAGWGVTNDSDAPSIPSKGDSVVTGLDSQVVQTGGFAIGCSGDSGGPLLDNGVLVGVISASDAQCAEFTLSTRISAHREWIASIAGAGNLPPIATGGKITAAPGQPVEITFEFSDPDSDSARIDAIGFDENLWDSQAISCVLEEAAQICVFTPREEFVGTTNITYRVADDAGATDTATWVVTFEFPPTAPVAEDVTASVVANRTSDISLTAFDLNEDPLLYTIVELPQHGDLSNCVANSCTYTPDANHEGSDSFTFTATDDGGKVSNIATVTIQVAPNEAPEVFDFTLEVGTNTPTGISLSGSDPNGDAVVFGIVSGPSNGVLSDCSTGWCDYTPNPDYEGLDSFAYTATDPDGLESALGTVTIDVVANFAPQANDISVATKSGVPVSIELAVYDHEGDPLTFQILSPPANGTLAACETGTCRYTPNGDFSGVDSFTWTASDASGTSQLAMATIDVAGINWDVIPLSSVADARSLMASVVDGDLTGVGEFSGELVAAGTFSGAADAIGIDTGIVLSTGSVVDVIGPNQNESWSTSHGAAGDDGLFPGIVTADAVSLQFEVVPTGDRLTFRYVLASDEYHDGGYVFPGFDDTAVVSVGGQTCGLPGVTDVLPLSVNSIRLGTYDEEFQQFEDQLNLDLFVDNALGSGSFDTEMDGFSTVLECSMSVVPGQPVVVTLAIADGGDGGIDSALFVEGDVITDGGDLLDELRGLAVGLPIATSLTAKIDAVKAAIDSERIASACGVLNALTKEVKAQSGRKIPTAIAAELLATAGRIAATLGCS